MARLVNRLSELRGWRGNLLLFIAGALMALGFAPLYFWPVIFISLPIFYLQLSNGNLKPILWRGFFFGYGYSMAGTWWIGNALLIDAAKFGWMLPFSILGLSAVMALWFVVFAALVYRLRHYYSVAMFAVLWVLVEYLRSIGMFGFPWNLVGYMSLASLPVAQLASVLGTYGLSFLIVLLGLMPIYLLTVNTRKQRVIIASVTIALLASVYGYGVMRLQQPREMTDIQLRIVQPNVPQEVKGTRKGQAVAAEVLTKLSKLETGVKPDVTIWPETAYPFTIRNDEQQFPMPTDLVLTGAMRAKADGKAIVLWNSIVAMNRDGDVMATYDKHQLVPFGEFVPLRSILPLDKITPGDVDFSRGEGPRSLQVAKLPLFSPLVCYEAIFPWLAVTRDARPEWLLNVTNDAWYGKSPGPYQHYDMARMRAIEQGLPMVRAANNGISAVIDSYGSAINSLGLYKTGVIDSKLPKAISKTYYYRWSDLPNLAILGLVAFYIIFGKSRRKNK